MMTTPAPPFGVDLADPAQRGLVEKIFRRRWASQVRAAGLDPDDVLQAVFMGILARNQGTRPWDPAISSLSNYSYIVIRSVVRNAVDQAKRAEKRGWVVGSSNDVATWDHPGMHSWQAPVPGAADLPAAVLARVAAGEHPLVVALSVVEDGVQGLLLGWSLVELAEERRPSGRRRRAARRRPQRKTTTGRKKRKTGMTTRALSLPPMITPAVLSDLQAVL
ncbi:MAG: hypothetical protein H6739_29305 [Alphaproteobacteria bacterium]|nr:hypothetical protein [Alphaproteobacteria bacterium]